MGRDTENEVRCGGHPVVQNRFLETGRVVEIRCQPIGAFDHLACTLGIECFVRIGNGRAAETGEEGQPAKTDKENNGTRYTLHLEKLYIWVQNYGRMVSCRNVLRLADCWHEGRCGHWCVPGPR